MSEQTQNSRNMKRLKDEQQVRQRAGVIFGTNDEHGAFHCIDELVSNSVDEARAGRCSLISVKVEDGDIVTVEDNGSGLPMHWNEDEKMYNWELALCTLYASGKYDDSQYSNALGLNGLGLTASQFASSFMDVWSTYDGKTWYMHFEKGKPKGELQILDPIIEGTGTKIRFQPDPEVFPALKNRCIGSNMYMTLLNTEAMLHDKLCIMLEHYELKQPIKFYYEKGMAEYIDKVVEDKKMLATVPDFSDKQSGVDDVDNDLTPYEVTMRVAFNFCRDRSVVQVYHNSSLLFEGGKTVEGFEYGITKAFTDCARAMNKLSKADKFLYKDIESMLICVVESNAPGNRTWFKNQTKGAVLNPFIGQCMAQFIYNKFRYWIENNKTISEKIINEIVVNKKAREEGAEVSKKVIRNLSKAVSFSSKPRYFINCSTKIISQKEIYIVEGRSALTSVKLACDPEFQAMFPARGKPINCVKEKMTRVLSNDIIVDIFRVLGCGIEAESKHIEDLPKFDINKLQWGKIIICTDADVDGMHIRCLLLAMFYVLAPSLLKAGKVYIAETPLYEIIYKDDIQFAYSDQEKEMVLQQLRDKGALDSKIKINRSKGLGENDPDMMAVSTMNPLTRRLLQVEYPEDDSELGMYFQSLLGDDIETRKLLIDEYFDLTEADV